MRYDHLASTQAKTTNCPRCLAQILVALDEGLTAKVDPQPLDQQGEIIALLEGRLTYTYTANKHLVHRDPGRIASGQPRGTVHQQHRCSRPIQTTIFDEMEN